MQVSGFEILEKIKVEIFPSLNDEVARRAASIVAEKIRKNNDAGKKTVLGLDAGPTLVDFYRELVKMHKEGLDFSRVVSFNSDEYRGIEKTNIASRHYFMFENFFNHVNMAKENIHLPDGMVKDEEVDEYCRKYEEEIKKEGGIDIGVLGVGRNGHLGFNEPNSSIDSRTRVVKLDDVTRRDAVGDFGELRYVPNEAITVGVANIMEAKEILLLACGNHKAKVIRIAIEGYVDGRVVASYLQKHPNIKFIIDEAAASELTRIKTPWVFDNMDWEDKKIRQKAVCFLSDSLNKKITELGSVDFLRHSLSSLLENYPMPDLTQEVRECIAEKIKDKEKLPKGKKILVFSPHPDDDVISMGGTLLKLSEQNDVTVAYMTSGYTAVRDSDTLKFIIERELYAERRGFQRDTYVLEKVRDYFNKKSLTRSNEVLIPEVLLINEIIRKAEAISACEYVGCKYKFLNLPFYQTGRARKNPVGEQDVKAVFETIKEIDPDLIFAAGDFEDPNGTHKQCLIAIIRALKRLDKKIELWLYAGAWSEYKIWEADALVSLSSAEIDEKKTAILRHASQSNNPPMPGQDKREFWQRAQERNAETARILNQNIGTDEIAIEAFRIIRDLSEIS